MEIILTGRGTGKTFKAIKLSAKNRLPIVCKDRAEATRVFNLADKKGYTIKFPLTFDEVIGREYYDRVINGVIIDNADMFLRHIMQGIKIEMVTMTKRKIVKGKNKGREKMRKQIGDQLNFY